MYDGWNAASYPMTGLLSDFSSSNYLNNNYFGGHYGPVSDFNKVAGFTLSNLRVSSRRLQTAAASYPNIFTSGAYLRRVSYEHDGFGRLHVVAGVRFEGTQMNALGYNVTLYPAGSKLCATSTGCGVPVPVRNNPFYVDILPSLSLRLALDAQSGLRMVYGRGVSRPDAYQLVPYVTEDDSSNPASVSIGNPSLKPAHANNYDLLYERYLNPTGIIQAGFFYKQIGNTMISTSYNAASGPYQGDFVSEWLNATNAQLYGFEISYQQRLSMLPGPLRAWECSRTTVGPARKSRPLGPQR